VINSPPSSLMSKSTNASILMTDLIVAREKISPVAINSPGAVGLIVLYSGNSRPINDVRTD